MPSSETKQQALHSVALLDRFDDLTGAARSRLITAFIEMMRSGDPRLGLLGWPTRPMPAQRRSATIGRGLWQL